MAAPVNTVPPLIVGYTPSGNTLNTTGGSWTGASSFTYQWTKGATGISGATGASYVTLPSQIGSAIGVTVTATNTTGSTPQASSNTITVTQLLSLCASIAKYLQVVASEPGHAAGLNFDGAGTKNCFAGFVPDTPDKMVAVLERPGAATQLSTTLLGPSGPVGDSQPPSLIDQPVIQIRVREAAGNYVTGNTLMQQVWGSLNGLSNVMLPLAGGMIFLLITAASYAAYLGIDAQNRPEWSLTMRVILNNTQRVTA